MLNSLLIRWMKCRVYFPLFHFYLELPLICIKSCLMHHIWNNRSFSYIAFEVKIWKWRFEIDLYEDMRRAQMKEGGYYARKNTH